jgi:citrate lyase beta subunit
MTTRNERMMEKAASSAADLVFLDLEDAVAPTQKEEAREKVIAALNGHDWGRRTVAVRMNAVGTIR